MWYSFGAMNQTLKDFGKMALVVLGGFLMMVALSSVYNLFFFNN